MKKFSVLVIVMTLGLFYALACYQQGDWMDKHEKSIILTSALTVDQDARSCPYTGYKNIKFASIQGGVKSEIYNEFYDEFTSQVSGKDHRYLNRGITCPELCEKELMPNEKMEIVNITKDPLTQFSGS